MEDLVCSVDARRSALDLSADTLSTDARRVLEPVNRLGAGVSPLREKVSWGRAGDLLGIQ